VETRYEQTLHVFEALKPGDQVELRHQVKVGFRQWEIATTGKVVHVERRRHGLHFQRNFDDKSFSDVIVLERDDGALTTVTLDEFSVLRLID
jgi:hypothetical protein